MEELENVSYLKMLYVSSTVFYLVFDAFWVLTCTDDVIMHEALLSHNYNTCGEFETVDWTRLLLLFSHPQLNFQSSSAHAILPQ